MCGVAEVHLVGVDIYPLCAQPAREVAAHTGGEICVSVSQTIAPIPIVFADAPQFDQGETEERPNPAPSARSTSASAAATNAPPTTAPQDTPDDDASLTGVPRETGDDVEGCMQIPFG